MGFWVFVLLAAVTTAQAQISFVFNETYALYGQGAFWDSEFSRIALLGTSHMPGETSDPLFFNDGRGVVFTGNQVVRLPPHPLDPRPISLGISFALEFWFRVNTNSVLTATPADRYILSRVKQSLNSNSMLLGVMFKRTHSVTAATTELTINVLDIWIDNTKYSLSFKATRLNGFTEFWDRWFHMVVNVDATGTNTVGNVYLDGVLMTDKAAAFSPAAGKFVDDENAAFFLGGRTTASTVGTANFNNVNAGDSSNSLMVYTANIYMGLTRSEAQVRSAISNTCAARFDRGDLKYLCDACPVNLGKCLFSGCSQTGFQRSSAECKESTNCDTNCGGYCTSDSQCAACSNSASSKYLSTTGACSACPTGCAACTGSSSCYECAAPSAAPWTGGISLERGKCSGVFALQLDATCMTQPLSLPLPSATTFTAWTVELWIYIQDSITGETSTDYEILNLGDFQLLYTRAGRIRMNTRAGQNYEDSTATGIYTEKKWTRVAFAIDSGAGNSGSLMVWHAFAENSRTNALGISRFSIASITNSPYYASPTKLLLCSKKCNILARDLRLWNVKRTETNVFETMFKVFTTTPPALVSYWTLDENSPMIFDYSYFAQNITLPQTRGQCWWKEQLVQYLRHTDSTLSELSQIANSGTYGLLQCPERRLNGDILFMCNQEIRFVFSQKCMPQDIADINRTVIARKGNSELAEADVDPYYDGKDAGLYFNGKSFLEIDPKHQAFQPVSETRWTSRQSDSRGIKMPLSLMDFSVEVWVKPDSLPTGAWTDDNGEFSNIKTLFSIMHTNGHHQFLWYLHSDGMGVSMRTASNGDRTNYANSDTKKITAGSWNFLAFSFSLLSTVENRGSMVMMINGDQLTTPLFYLGSTMADYVVRTQAPMFLGASVKGTTLNNFYKGYMFEFALGNFARPSTYVQAYDIVVSGTLLVYSPWYGSSISNSAMQGNECACHFSCLTCSSPRTGLENSCLSCAAPLVLSEGKCILECPTRSVIESETSRVCITVTAPTISAAVFRSDFLGLDITFSVAVAPATQGNDCDLMFAAETSAQFGFGAYCYQSSSDSKLVSVIFGQSPTFPLAGTLRLHPRGFLKTGETSRVYASTAAFQLTAATVLPAPTAIIAGPDLSPVDGQDVVIDAGFSRGGLARPLSYKWAVIADGVELSADLTKHLKQFADFTAYSKLVIPAALAPTSARVSYTVTVRNWLQMTNSASLDSFHTLRPVPLMYFTQGRTWTVKRWEENVFQLTLSKSATSDIPSDKKLAIRIVDTTADLTANPLTLYADQFLLQNRTLSIPPDTLQVGKNYRLVVELTSQTRPECNSFASLNLAVAQSGFVPVIVGGDRTIGVLDKVNVTATGSYELDTKTDTNIVYGWKCSECTPTTFVGRDYTATLASTSVGKTVRVELTLTSSIKDDSRTASEYADFAVVAGSRSYLFVHRLPSNAHATLSEKVKFLLPEKANFLHADVYLISRTNSVMPEVAWTAAPAPINFALGFEPKKNYWNTVAFGAGMYLPTRQYTITITLDENSAYTSAWLRVPVNARPIGCCFSVTLIPASRNLFLFDAGHHEDPDNHYPLRYVFGLEKYNAHFNFGTQSPQKKYILPSRNNHDENYQVTAYVAVYDSLDAVTKELYEVSVFPESEQYSLEDFQAEAAATYAAVYNQTVLDQYVFASYAAYLNDQFARGVATFDQSAAALELKSLVSLLSSIISSGDQECIDLKVYLRDLALLSPLAAKLSESLIETLFTLAAGILSQANTNPDRSCLSTADKSRFMDILNDLTVSLPAHSALLTRLEPLIETFGFVAMRNSYPGGYRLYTRSHVTAKFWRRAVENADKTYEFLTTELNSTVLHNTGMTFPRDALSSKPGPTAIDVHVVASGFSGYAPMRLDRYPTVLAEHGVDRFEVVENGEMQAMILQTKVFESGKIVDGDITLGDVPTTVDLPEAKVTLHFPLLRSDLDSLMFATCETWQADDSTAETTYGGQWTLDSCNQTNSLDDMGTLTCICDGLGTVSSNLMTPQNLGPLRVEIVQAELDPEYDLKKEINDNRAFMFYMNPIYLLFILWSLHGGLIIFAYLADRDAKPDYVRDEYALVAATERRVDEPRPLPIPSFGAFWLNEWWVTGLIRSTKPHYTRCERVHILLTKMYVLLLVPGFFYTYYWTSNEAFDIQGYDWGVTMIALICSAATQGLLSVLSNTRNVPVAIKRALYIAYFGVWTTMWLAIGFWTAKGTTQTASIWCVVWILCAFIDVLIVDHLYVMVKWGFDASTDYWRIMSSARPAEGESS